MEAAAPWGSGILLVCTASIGFYYSVALAT